jgi:hypothetical protein
MDMTASAASCMDNKGRSRTVLLHAHMFKNAGSTFDWSLRRCFRGDFLDHRDDDAMRQGATYLGPYLLEHEHLQALSSHWVSFPLPQARDIDLQLALFFRHPLERMRSVYAFERQQQGDIAPGIAKARELKFLDYVRWRLQADVGPVIRNYQTRYCSGKYMGEDIEAMYDLAVATIESTPLLGLVHRYDESMVLFEYHLQKIFPGLDLSWKLQNSSCADRLSAAAKRSAAERDLAPVMDQVVAANVYDLKLFAAVESRFERALARVPDFQRRLQRLRMRCEILQ